MLTILGGRQGTCAGVTRRRLIQAGGAGLFGLTLPKVLAASETSHRPRGRAKSVIFLFLFGGPSQYETFDLKPEAPDTVRGPFKPIRSRTPELKISEHLPQLAGVSDRFCVVRSVGHTFNDHSTAGHYIQTGHPWHVPIGGGFNATEKDWPSMGSVVEYFAQREAGGANRPMPAYCFVPNRLGRLQMEGLLRPGQYAGWLGRGYDALTTAVQKRDAKDNPYFRDCNDADLDFRIDGLASREGLTLDRIDRRRSLLDQFDAGRRGIDSGAKVESFDRHRQRAFSMIASPRIREALDIKREPDKLRDRYGRSLFGQSTLMARRLVEAGARFVTVGWDAPDGYSWDSHVNSEDVRKHLLPGLDSALSALLIDLETRGLLDETLVVCLGEMGRTAAPTKTWGRGHWSKLFPAVLAGAGVRGGSVYGRSDRNGTEAVESPVAPEDLAATVLGALGIDHHARVPDALGRPVDLIDNGRPLDAIFG